jgi:hypothetical protein
MRTHAGERARLPGRAGMLALSPPDYEHSSAKFYTFHQQGRYEVISHRELEDIDLSK